MHRSEKRAATRGWIAGKFLVRTHVGSWTQRGLVRGGFALDEREPDTWVLTHRPTGIAVLSGTSAVAVQVAAHVCEELVPRIQWENCTSPEQLARVATVDTLRELKRTIDLLPDVWNGGHKRRPEAE
jgi:hypothetical protein